ncbi:MAG: peptide deformylase, partial [Myxococcales bacterium]|nr:peptide deformylase [Myxococcales bacterium]
MTAFDLDAWLRDSSSPAPIVQAGAAVLRRRAALVPRALLGSDALAQLEAIMVDTMRAAPGVGLAAPQIGVPLRVYVAEDREENLAQVPEESR